MAYRDFVAHVHDGKVLLDDAGLLPSITSEDDDDASFADKLDLVGADLPISPTTQVADGVYVTTVVARDGVAPAGRWVELTALTDPIDVPGVADAVRRDVEEHAGSTPPHRPDWFRPGWADRAEAWVDAALAQAGRARTGPIRAVRMWSLSAVLRVPTDDGDAWFKATCDHFHGEPGIHRVLAEHFPNFVPVLIAEDDDRAWLLMEQLHGASEQEQADGVALALAASYPKVQLATADLLDELRAAGCRERGLRPTLEGWRHALEHSVELPRLTDAELGAVRDVSEEVEALVEEFWACGIPDTLSHGDLHLGNVAYDGTELRVFDWTDGCISHPFIDGGHLLRYGAAAGAGSVPRPDPSVLDAFSAPWRAAYPDAAVDRALTLAPLVDRVFQIVSYEGIYRATEERSMWELGGIVAQLLRGIPESLPEFR